MNYFEADLMTGVGTAASSVELTVILACMVIMFFVLLFFFVRSQSKIIRNDKIFDNLVIYFCKSNTSVRKLDLDKSISTEYSIKNGKISTKDYKLKIKEGINTYIDPDEWDRVWLLASPEKLRRLHKSGETLVFESKGRVGNKGGMKWMSFVIIPLGNPDDSNNTFFLITKDIDDEKKEEIRKKEALNSALRAENIADNMKIAFINNICKEIKNPLNSIVGMAQIAERTPGNKEKVLDCLGHIQDSSENLLELINQILDVSKYSDDTMLLEESASSITDIINNLIEKTEKASDKKNIKVIYDRTGVKNNNIICDSKKLVGVLEHLVSNAIKYTPVDGRIKIDVSEQDGSKSGTGNYTFSVIDNGIGIPDDFIGKVFDPFVRTESDDENDVTAGLGLFICKSIVNVMGGAIDVESSIGKGSVFTVRLPLKYVSRSVPDENKSAQTKTEKEVFTYDKKMFKGKNILLVEDNAVNAEVVKTALGLAGANVECAKNGEIAVENVSNSMEGYYSIIIMDIQMPVRNGYDATREIRQLDREDAVEIPIVALSVNSDEADIKKERDAGMNDHLSKPVDILKLTITIKKWLNM